MKPQMYLCLYRGRQSKAVLQLSSCCNQDAAIPCNICSSATLLVHIAAAPSQGKHVRSSHECTQKVVNLTVGCARRWQRPICSSA